MIDLEKPENALDIAQLDLLELGDGEVGYVRYLKKDDLPELPDDVRIEDAWGVYSAKGEPMALCDSVNAAWHFGADHDLDIVSVH